MNVGGVFSMASRSLLEKSMAQGISRYLSGVQSRVVHISQSCMLNKSCCSIFMNSKNTFIGLSLHKAAY